MYDSYVCAPRELLCVFVCNVFMFVCTSYMYMHDMYHM